MRQPDRIQNSTTISCSRPHHAFASLTFVLMAMVVVSCRSITFAFDPSSVPLISRMPTPLTATSPFYLTRERSYTYAQKMKKSSLMRPSTTARRMVLTTPESIIEQASTQNLLDDLIDESVRTSARRPIMMQFDPSSGWIWRRWKGTVFSETWTSCVKNMAYALIILMIYQANPGLKHFLSGFGTLWAQLLSVTTFTLTFFVNQSYALWRKCSELSRRLQGRLHDVGLNLATHAARKSPSNPDEPSTYTPAARQILELMSRYIRLFNLLTYASFTRSHRPILTPRGMRRLVERGLMTPLEREVLTEASIPGTQRHSAILMWMMRLFYEGRASGHILGGDGFEQQTIEKFHIIRSQYGAIGDELQGRMPLAYAHIVQILVDLILWMYPLMALSSGVSPLLTIIGAGLLTLSYQGLFDLAKQFLDPYDNENYGKGEDPLCVDTLIAETNAGSVRWMYGFEEMPFNAQRLKDGELYDYLLPVRGYTVEELAQIEEERIKKEQEREEQRKREEALREEREEAKRFEIEELQFEEEVAVAQSFLSNTTENSLVSNASAKAMNWGAVAPANEEFVSPLNTTDARSKNNETILQNATFQSESPKHIHKVTTLAGGKLFSQKSADQINEREIAPVPVATTTYLASLQKMSEKETKRRVVEKAMEDTFVPDLSGVDFGMFDELPNWFEEINEDGQEVRLSQMLADEEWQEANTTQQVALTFDEYSKRAAEIIQTAENELIETEEIMNAEPGSQEYEEKLQELKEEKREAPVYDQTRLDGISQLWGLPPEDPDAFADFGAPESVEEVSFDGITQLWGGSSSSEPPQDDDEVVGLKSFDGISELWESDPNRSISLDPKEELTDEMDDSIRSAYPDLWHDEKEFRLSEMLADEKWEDVQSVVTDNDAPMTLEDYNSQVSEILAAAEEELLETEAILLAAPGADPDNWEVKPPTTNATQVEDAVGESVESPKEVSEEQGDLDILEMDSKETSEYSFPDDSEGISRSMKEEKMCVELAAEAEDDNKTSEAENNKSEPHIEDDLKDDNDLPSWIPKNSDKVQPILVTPETEDTLNGEERPSEVEGDDEESLST